MLSRHICRDLTFFLTFDTYSTHIRHHFRSPGFWVDFSDLDPTAKIRCPASYVRHPQALKNCTKHTEIHNWKECPHSMDNGHWTTINFVTLLHRVSMHLSICILEQAAANRGIYITLVCTLYSKTSKYLRNVHSTVY